MDNFDLDGAARAGLISEDQAQKLRNFHAAARDESLADQERFGSVDGMSDVMTALGVGLAIGAVSVIGYTTSLLAGPLIAALCWGLARIFTLRRRLTLTSFVLFGFYILGMTICGVVVAVLMTGTDLTLEQTRLAMALGVRFTPMHGVIIGLFSAVAAALYWRVFRFPIAYAVALFAAVNVLTQTMRLLLPDAAGWVANVVLLMSGLLFFVVAMAWDISDVRRETRRADVGFWLHVFAGYMLARAMFKMVFDLGSKTRGWDRLFTDALVPPDILAAVAAICIALLFIIVALAIDRRALLLSSLGYVLPAVAMLAGTSVYKAPTVAGLIVGLTLAVTAAFWRPLRRYVLDGLPLAVQAQLPRTDLKFERPRPVT
jgi:hypothetical protein